MNHAGKKITLSLGFIAASVAYIFYVQPSSNTVDYVQQATPLTQPSSATPNASSEQQPTASSAPTPSPIAAVTAPVVTVNKPRGMYTDGTYTGTQEDAYYGMVQVQVAVTGGKLSDVNFLQYPTDRRTSQNISSRAMPILKQEAIVAQSARVDTVSGATEISNAFVRSLGSALSQAKS